MKRKILNSFIIFIVGILLSACNKKEIKSENSFLGGNEESEVQLTDSDIINNSNTKKDIETKINYADSEKNKWINEILEYNTRGEGYIRYFNDIGIFPMQKKEFLSLSIFDKKIGMKSEKNINLLLGKDVLLDDSTGFLYFIFDEKKYLYIPAEKHPVVFQDGYQNSVPYTQVQLQNLKVSYENWRWAFYIERISTSSFLTENTKNGEWKYDGNDIERFPIVWTPDKKYDFISMPWVEGVAGDGVGEWIELELNGYISNLYILNGYVDIRRPHLFKENNRIKEATLICTIENTDEEIFEKKVTFEDFVYVKNIELGEDFKKNVRLRIDSVFKGSKYDDTAITSIYTEYTVIEH